jgi:hypothetical protein
LDTGGGFLDTVTTSIISAYPTVEVFDVQSNPMLSASVGITPMSAKFCVYFKYPGASDSSIGVIEPYDQLLTQIVGLWKAAGTTPVYAAASPP